MGRLKRVEFHIAGKARNFVIQAKTKYVSRFPRMSTNVMINRKD